MTERKKMLAGELYDANFDPELLRQRLAAENLTWGTMPCGRMIPGERRS